MNIWVENYINARNFKPVEPTIALRIFDPGTAKNPKDKDGDWRNGPKAPFPSELYEAVWSYTFDDVLYDGYPEDYARELMARPNYYPLSANVADDIVRRFIRVKDDISAMLFHCHAGVSRSVAVAHALVEMFEIDARWCGRAARVMNRENDYVGNEYVYRLVCEAAERTM